MLLLVTLLAMLRPKKKTEKIQIMNACLLDLAVARVWIICSVDVAA